MSSGSKVLILGANSIGCLERSYASAFMEIGCSIKHIDTEERWQKHSRFGDLGRSFFRFVSIEPWVAKGNREIVLAAFEFRPNIVIVFGAEQVRAGCLAQIAANDPNVKIVLYWPDPLLRLSPSVLDCLCFYDFVFTFSRAQVAALKRLGVKRATWLPLAFDHNLHQCNRLLNGGNDKGADVCFIGNHRPERDALFQQLSSYGFVVKIWGSNDWVRSTTNKPLMKKLWQGRAIFGQEYAREVQRAKTVVNLVDQTTPGAANMRYFEILGLGGVLLTQFPCELVGEFPEGISCVYFDDTKELIEKLRIVLSDNDRCDKIGRAAEEKIMDAHTYVHRARQMLVDVFGFSL